MSMIVVPDPVIGDREIHTSDEIGDESILSDSWEYPKTRPWTYGRDRSPHMSQREIEDRKVRRLSNLLGVMCDEYMDLPDGPAKDRKALEMQETQRELAKLRRI